MHAPLLPSRNSSCTRPAVTCASCLFGASTKILTFPYNITQTVDVTIIPCVTGLPNGTNFTYGYETITPSGLPTHSGVPTVFEDNSTTIWVTDGATLTYPTTYASFGNFSGFAAPTPAPTACAQSKYIHPIYLPATTDPASLIYTPTAGTNAFKELHFGQLPTKLLAYLDSLSTVVHQLGGNRPGTCLSTSTSAPSACKTSRPSMQNFTIPSNISLEGHPPESVGPPLGSPESGPPAIQKIPAVVLRRTSGPVKFTPYRAQDATKPNVEAAHFPGIGNNNANGGNQNDGGNSSAQSNHPDQQRAGNQPPSNPNSETRPESSGNKFSSNGQPPNVNGGSSSSGSTSPPSVETSVSGTDRYSASSLTPNETNQSLAPSGHNDAASFGVPSSGSWSPGSNSQTGLSSGETPASGASNTSDTTNSGKSSNASATVTPDGRKGNASSTATNISAANRRGISTLGAVVIIAAIAAAA